MQRGRQHDNFATANQCIKYILFFSLVLLLWYFYIHIHFELWLWAFSLSLISLSKSVPINQHKSIIVWIESQRTATATYNPTEWWLSLFIHRSRCYPNTNACSANGAEKLLRNFCDNSTSIRHVRTFVCDIQSIEAIT